MSAPTIKNKTGKTADVFSLPDQVVKTIKSFNENDPVARQYYPSSDEKIISLKENPDPIGDHVHSPLKGLVHRHKSRVLLKITDTCAVYCRFCFRKEMVGKGQGILKDHDVEKIISYIEKHQEINEVIFSGGDPLNLSNRRLSALMQQLEKINNIDIIRFHTRVPIVTPQRIDQEFIDIINRCSKAVYIVLHVNHAQEIDQTVKDMISRLVKSKAVLLSQSVLLKGVNDNVDALSDLFHSLVKNSVKPYYLHHPDLAPGTGHFRVSIAQGQALMKELRRKISGLCIPSYVLDIPGGHGKIPVDHCYLSSLQDNGYSVEDTRGNTHRYIEENG
ncbi:MAG TPA: lysine-2,3-aminomutase-like protein [Alphaproteobacteria bacterium]|nr:lysine-2,3-aminomutase-like protein [Alphaproteobacteria bacterium]